MSASRGTPSFSEEGRIALGVGTNKTGSLRVLGIDYPLRHLTKGQGFEKCPEIFSAKLNSSSKKYSFLLTSAMVNPIFGSINEQFLSLQNKNAKLSVQQPQQPQQFSQNSHSNQNNHINQNSEMRITNILYIHDDQYDSISPSRIGVDSSKKTLALQGAHNALIWVHSFGINVMNTVKHTVKSLHCTSGHSQHRHSYLDPSPSEYQKYTIKVQECFPEEKPIFTWETPKLFIENPSQNNVDSQHPSQHTHHYHHFIPACPFEIQFASVTDNVIAVSNSNIVIVLYWSPPKPVETNLNLPLSHIIKDSHTNANEKEFCSKISTTPDEGSSTS
jgi:hypothetical protein